MSPLFAELARVETAMGQLSLRRRREPTRDVDVFEVKLDDDYLMSSLFTVAETELARLALARCAGTSITVVVGGLGLGYTASAVLADHRVSQLIVVEALAPVIEWHESALLPESTGLLDDLRCRFVHGDFFALARGDDGFDPTAQGGRVDAILVDIDHAPGHVLDPAHEHFYTPAGLAGMARFLKPHGVFGLWSNDPPDDGFQRVLDGVFDEAWVEVVEFPNFLTGGTSANTVYLAADPVTAEPDH